MQKRILPLFLLSFIIFKADAQNLASQVTATNPVYCITKGTTGREYINQVSIGTINNTSGNNNGYGNYTSLSTTLSEIENSITLTPGFTGSARVEYWTVFIDYNNDGVFDNATEKAASGKSKAAITLTLPGVGLPDPDDPNPVTSTRMRIIMHYLTSRSNTCGNFSYGEVEDYTVNFPQPAIGFSATGKTILSNNILVKPNPSNGSNVKVQLQITQAKPVTLSITDLSGRIMYVDRNLSSIGGKNVFSLNNLNLKSGTYIIVVEQNNRVVARTKFIVAE